MQQTVSDRWMVTTSGILQWAIRIQAPSRRRLPVWAGVPLGYPADNWRSMGKVQRADGRGLSQYGLRCALVPCESKQLCNPERELAAGTFGAVATT